MLHYTEIVKNEKIRTYIKEADRSLLALGYTEHSFPHVTRVATVAAQILHTLGRDERVCELARIAGYLHDIGNLVNRIAHSQSGAIMALCLLQEMNADAEEIAIITTAIGNHDEGTGVPVSDVSAALILADKSDVRRTRVRNEDPASFDIHDRVNYSVTASDLMTDLEEGTVTLSLTVDTAYGSVMDYFEIFLDRMLLCRKAAERLKLTFKLLINGQSLV